VVPDADLPATKLGVFINGWGINGTTIWGNLKSSQVLISAPIPKFSGPYLKRRTENIRCLVNGQ